MTSALANTDVESIEVDLLLEAVYRKYGYDFRNYAKSSITRRVLHALQQFDVKTISELQHLILIDKSVFDRVLPDLTVNVTEMFRDPPAYLSVRDNVIPLLRTYPHIKVWHAGCATGEEVYSMAILLEEENLYKRSQIYATDINELVLRKAQQGVYATDQIQEYTRNYHRAGGKEPFTDYFRARDGYAIFSNSLRENVLFSDHNLVTDSSFGEMHLVICRNLMIYFDRELQNRALGLFTESLVDGGFLWLGSKETIQFSDYSGRFEKIDGKEKIYKKIG